MPIAQNKRECEKYKIIVKHHPTKNNCSEIITVVVRVPNKGLAPDCTTFYHLEDDHFKWSEVQCCPEQPRCNFNKDGRDSRENAHKTQSLASSDSLETRPMLEKDPDYLESKVDSDGIESATSSLNDGYNYSFHLSQSCSMAKKVIKRIKFTSGSRNSSSTSFDTNRSANRGRFEQESRRQYAQMTYPQLKDVFRIIQMSLESFDNNQSSASTS